MEQTIYAIEVKEFYRIKYFPVQVLQAETFTRQLVKALVRFKAPAGCLNEEQEVYVERLEEFYVPKDKLKQVNVSQIETRPNF